MLLQNGRESPSPEEEEEPSAKIPGLDLTTWEDRSYEQRQKNLKILSIQEMPVREDEERGELGTKEPSSPAIVEAPSTASTVVVRERTRTSDESSQKNTRAKRESRRMRELEQAKFSLELLKVRASSGGASSPPEERRWSAELVPPAASPLCSPGGTPDSQSSKGSFELLSLDDEPPKATEEVMDIEDTCSPSPTVIQEPESNAEVVLTNPKSYDSQTAEVSDAAPPDSQKLQNQMDLTSASNATHLPKIDNYLPTFYTPASEGPAVIFHPPAVKPLQDTEAAVSTIKPQKERQESIRRPVVVVISMQKETPLREELSAFIRPQVQLQDAAAQTGELTPSPQKPDPVPGPDPFSGSTSVPQADQAVIEKLVRLNEEKEERQRNQQQQNEREMMEQIRQQKELLERQRLFFAKYENEMFEKHRGEALHRIQQSRKSRTDVGAPEARARPPRPSSLLTEKTKGVAPHARTQSDSTAPSVAPPAAAAEIRGRALHNLLPHPQTSQTSAPKEKPQRVRPSPEGWAPKLTLESRDGGGTRGRTAASKQADHPGTTGNLVDKPGNIFFSPKDKVTFTK